MNRHERRAKAAQERRDRGPVQSVLIDGEAKERFQRHMMSEEQIALFERVVALMLDWRKANPDRTPLWHPPPEKGGIVFIGPLDAPEAQELIAANEAGMDLLAWIAEQTGGQASTLHALYAAEYVDERVRQHIAEQPGSEALKLMHSFALGAGRTSRMRESPCPFCGTMMSAASAGSEDSPSPGSSAVCVACGNVSCFADDMTVRRYTDEEWAALPQELRAYLGEVRAMFQAAALRRPGQARGDA